MHNYLQNIYFHNRILDYLIAGEILFGGLAVIWTARIPIRRWASRPEERRFFPKLIDQLSRPLFQSLQALMPYLALEHLKLPHNSGRLLHAYAATAFMVGLVRLGVRAIRFMLLDYWSHRNADRRSYDRQFRGLMPVVSIAIWSAGIVFLMDNLGVNISTVVAGLGIGGVAIALASQAVLADLFSYFAIVFDRPFDIDDVITVDQFTGTVEYIGIKTTRLRSVSGEQLILANSDITKSRLRNHRRLKTRRVEFVVSVAYDNASEKLEQLPQMMRELITPLEGIKFDQANITAMNATSVDLKVTYVVLSDSAAKYTAAHQSILLALKRALDAREIALAVPQQRFVMARDTRPPVAFPPEAEVVSGDSIAA